MKAILWEASDGTRFDNELLCLNYEKSLPHCWNGGDQLITKEEDISAQAAFMMIQEKNVEKINKIFHDEDDLPNGGFSAGIWYFCEGDWLKLEDSEQFV